MNKDQIASKLTKYGHRATTSRLEVAEALLRYHGHMTADDLYAKMQENGSDVGRMTVFRTLDLLAEIGVVRPTYGGSGAAHFVLLEDGHHHHMVCMQCDQTIEFAECSLADSLSSDLASKFNFKIEGHLLEIYGICADCQ